MRPAPVVGPLLAIVAAGAAWGGYAELLNEIDGYGPPALHQAALAPKPAGPLSAPAASDFEAQLGRLREAKAAWEKTLTTPAEEEVFLVPSPSALERLRPAAGDAAAAERALGDGFPLEDLEALALLRNPGAAAKEREFRATLDGYGQVEALDSVLRRYATLTGSLMTGVGAMENPDAAALKFPFPGLLALKGQVVGQDARALREELEAARRDAVTAVRKAYWELLYLHKAREVAGEMLTLLDNLKAAASTRYASGASSFQDSIRLGVEREKMREELTTLAEEQKNTEAEIREALALSPNARIGAPALGEPEDGVPTLEALYAVARERGQEVRARRAMLGKMERMLEMAETMVYPGFSLNLSAYDRGEIGRVAAAGMEGGAGSFPETTSAAMGEGLPKMPWYGRDEAYVRETRQRVEGLRREIERAEASSDLGVRRAWFRLDRARRERDLYRDRVSPLSQAALEASARGYSAGKVMFADVIETYRGWFEAKLSLERAKADLGIGRAELESAVGTSRLP